MFFTKVFYKDKTIDDALLEISDKGSRYSFGPDLTLNNCTLIFKISARNLFIHEKTNFINCSIEAKQELKNHQDWVFAFLKSCRFKGRFSGCEFGRRPDFGNGWEHGSIEDCDFSEARLDGCRFHGCDPATLRLPKWPCFTILDPVGRQRELQRVTWPGRFGRIIVDNLHKSPPSTVAVTCFAPAEAKQFDTTPEALKAVIEKFDFIVH